MTVPAIVRVDALSLRQFYVEAFQGSGVAQAGAVTAADGLHFADLRGVDSHGAANLEPLYLRMLADGTVDGRAVPTVVKATGAVATVDAANALGFVAGQMAMTEAVERAKHYGVGAVAVRRSSHCGCLAYYTAAAVEARMIGLALTNLGRQAILRPINGRQPLLGTNALAAAAPTRCHPAFSLDATTAVAATGRVKAALRAGQQLPAGWLADDEGQPVHDPAALLEGTAHLQWLGGQAASGGHKGYGLAVLIDILAGLLPGAAVGPNHDNLAGRRPLGPEDDDIGQFFLALDPAAFGPSGQFSEALDDMLETLLLCEPVTADLPVQYPGSFEAQVLSERTVNGVPLLAATFAELLAVAERLDIDPPTKTVGGR